MPGWTISLIWAGIIALLFFLVIVPVFVIPLMLYNILLVRSSKKKWTRKCSDTKDQEQIEMFAQGQKWLENYSSRKESVHIVSEGFNLYGEYFDFGFDKAAIIIAGRSEGCTYSCYFSDPYRAAGYNVLVIDNRSHGLSDGKFNNVGFKEWPDIINWAKFLHQEKACKSIVCHGICIGSAAALYAFTSADCPEYMNALVADGMFSRFRDIFENHLKKRHHAKFPTSNIVMLLISIASGRNAFKDGPVNYIGKMKKPVLFIYSREDKFSPPDMGQKMYDLCQAPKKLVWFEHGVHSHVRINAPEKYDQTIISFLKENVDE